MSKVILESMGFGTEDYIAEVQDGGTHLYIRSREEMGGFYFPIAGWPQIQAAVKGAMITFEQAKRVVIVEIESHLNQE